jgi:murein DD-endopeptidase MepM/ murein hydrolase activator NlpD
MSRLPRRAGGLGLAVSLALWLVAASPATALTLPSPTPAPLPVPTLPLPILPTPGVSSVPGPSEGVNVSPPLNTPGVLDAVAMAPGSSTWSTVSGQSLATTPAPPASRPYQAPPDEQASLPNEPERIAYEQQQQDVSDFNAQMQKELGAIALEAGGGSGRFSWPVVITKTQVIPLTQRFGCSDVAGEPYKADCPTKRWHTGIDLGVAAGTPIFASDAGVARTFRSGSGYGNYVIVVHGNGYATLYGHLSGFAVPDGQIVEKGDQVGFAGSTGYSTGPHLHFEIRFDKDYVDPCAELKC